MNGQVVMWDIAAHVDRLKQPRSSAKKKNAMNTLVSLRLSGECLAYHYHVISGDYTLTSIAKSSVLHYRSSQHTILRISQLIP